MKHLLLSLILISTVSLAQRVPCVDGMAGDYPCNGYDLMSHIDLGTLSAGASLANDSWGWTDPETGNEYAIVGLSDGTAFIDISDPISPVHVATLPTQTVSSSWRDVKVFENHAYVVSEAQGHGMQIFDLTRLRNVISTPQTFLADAVNTSFGSAHNIVINEDTGYAYPVGARNFLGTARMFNGGPIFININGVADGSAPSGTNEGGYGMDLYSHDAQVVTYNGPDTRFTGDEILIGSNENEIAIVDISDKANPVSLSTISYDVVEYTHQGWFTEDQRYFILGDELDESRNGFPTRTLVFDFNELDNPSFQYQYDGPTNAIDHNGYVLGNTFYLANYTAGFREIEVIQDNSLSNVDDSVFMVERGFFDTYPEDDTAAFNGAWNVYPYFASENILISDINRGFFLISRSETLSLEDISDLETTFSIYPNPTSGPFKININTSIEGLKVYDVTGKLIKDFSASPENLNLTGLSNGVYFVQINNSLVHQIVKE